MEKAGLHLFVFMIISIECFSQSYNLEFYLKSALANSPLLKDYELQIASNLIDSQRIRASYLPQVNGTSANSFAPVINGFGYDNAITNGGNVSVLAEVTKNFVSSRHLAAQFHAIQLQNRAITNTAKISEQELKRTVIAQYITAYGSMQQVKFTESALSILKKEEAILRRLTTQNVYRQTDYLTFRVTMQQQELAYRQLQIRLQNDRATLNDLCGIQDTSAIDLAVPELQISHLPQKQESIFFIQYRLDSLQLVNNSDLIDFNYQPKIGFYANGGYNSTFAYQGYKNLGISLGFNLSIPIFDGGQRKLQHRKIAIAERTSSFYKNFFTKQYDQQLAQLLQQLHATEALSSEINTSIKYAESLITVNGKLMETGDARIADFVIAINTYLNAKNTLAQNEVSRLQIINQINYWNR